MTDLKIPTLSVPLALSIWTLGSLFSGSATTPVTDYLKTDIIPYNTISRAESPVVNATYLRRFEYNNSIW